MDFKFFSFAPHMVKHTLNLIKRRCLSIVVPNNKIFVNCCPFFEDRVKYQYTRPSIFRYSDRSWAATKGFVLSLTKPLD